MDALLDDDDDWHTHWVTLPLNSCLLAAICRASSQLIPWLLSLYVYYRSNFSLILQVSSSPCPSCRVELVLPVCHHPSLNDDQAISVFFQQGNESKPTNTTTSSFYFSRNHSRLTSLLKVSLGSRDPGHAHLRVVLWSIPKEVASARLFAGWIPSCYSTKSGRVVNCQNTGHIPSYGTQHFNGHFPREPALGSCSWIVLPCDSQTASSYRCRD